MTDVASFFKFDTAQYRSVLEFLKPTFAACNTARTSTFRDLYEIINEFKKGCQPRTKLVKYENGIYACRFPHFE
jgi:hypothetical protein